MDGEEADDRDDATLIAESRDNPERFAALFDRHAATIYQYMARRLGEQSAEDLVTEVFTIAFRKRARYRQDYTDARPWLYGIATNLVNQHRRDEARKYRALARTGVDPVIENHADSVATDVTVRGVRRQLGDALARLPAKDRDALLLHVWQELSYGEIAHALDVPLGTVRSRLSRARRRMREQLGDHTADVMGREFSYG